MSLTVTAPSSIKVYTDYYPLNPDGNIWVLECNSFALTKLQLSMRISRAVYHGKMKKERRITQGQGANIRIMFYLSNIDPNFHIQLLKFKAQKDEHQTPIVVKEESQIPSTPLPVLVEEEVKDTETKTSSFFNHTTKCADQTDHPTQLEIETAQFVAEHVEKVTNLSKRDRILNLLNSAHNPLRRQRVQELIDPSFAVLNQHYGQIADWLVANPEKVYEDDLFLSSKTRDFVVAILDN